MLRLLISDSLEGDYAGIREHEPAPHSGPSGSRLYQTFGASGAWTVGACSILLLATGCDSSAVTPGEGVDRDVDPPELVWPLSNTDAADADSVHSPFGPRALPSRYDFHAGIDIPAPRGTRVRAVLPGRVILVSTWNGTSTGAGNSILIAHPGDRSTSYLHLHQLLASEGDSVIAGQIIGTVGSTGATYPHLHLGYFEGLPRDTRVHDERLSRNPLELLPNTSDTLYASFSEHGVVLDLPLQRMTVRTIRIVGTETDQVRTLDYYEVVARGATSRDEHVQQGVHIDAGRPEHGRFDLFLNPDAPGFRVERVVVLDTGGQVLLDESRP